MAARSGDSHDVRQPDEGAEPFTLHEDQWGFVFSPSASMPRGAATVGVFVDALDLFLNERPAEDGLLNQVWWLQPPR